MDGCEARVPTAVLAASFPLCAYYKDSLALFSWIPGLTVVAGQQVVKVVHAIIEYCAASEDDGRRRPFAQLPDPIVLCNTAPRFSSALDVRRLSWEQRSRMERVRGGRKKSGNGAQSSQQALSMMITLYRENPIRASQIYLFSLRLASF